MEDNNSKYGDTQHIDWYQARDFPNDDVRLLFLYKRIYILKWYLRCNYNKLLYYIPIVYYRQIYRDRGL